MRTCTTIRYPNTNTNSPFIHLLVDQVTAKLAKSLGRSSVVGRKSPSSDCVSESNGSDPLTNDGSKYQGC